MFKRIAACEKFVKLFVCQIELGGAGHRAEGQKVSRKRCGCRFGIGRQKLKDGVRDKAKKRLDVYVDFAFHFHSLLLSILFTEVGC